MLVKLLGHRTVNTTLRYLLAQLDHEAKARRVTRSWLVRESLERALSKESPASNAKRLRPTLLTCEPVLTEAAFLLKCDDRDADALFEREVVMRADAAGPRPRRPGAVPPGLHFFQPACEAEWG